jgi:hypothetical protein
MTEFITVNILKSSRQFPNIYQISLALYGFGISGWLMPRGVHAPRLPNVVVNISAKVQSEAVKYSVGLGVLLYFYVISFG